MIIFKVYNFEHNIDEVKIAEEKYGKERLGSYVYVEPLTLDNKTLQLIHSNSEN